mgnify:CR=1 FL=1
MQNNGRKRFPIVKAIVLVFMLAVTLVSWFLADRIYGEGSVFNAAPTGVDSVDAIYQSMPEAIDCIRLVFLLYVFTKVVQFIVTRTMSSNKKSMTAAKMICSFVKYVVAILAILSVLSVLGLDTATLVASAGLVTLVVGLGAQSLIADVVAGLFTVFEGEYGVGDIVVIDGWRGEIEEIGIRSTRLVDAGGNVKIINNSEIVSVVNQTQNYSVVTTIVPIEYEESLIMVEGVIEANLDRIKAAIPEIVNGPYYKGVNALGPSSVDLLFIALWTMNRELKLLFDENGINIPYQQVVVHQAVPQDASSGPVDCSSDGFVAEQSRISKDLEANQT